MKTNKKKMLSGILALSAVSCLALGIAFQSDDAVNVSAADSTMSVNTLGYLEWAEVADATSYEVSSVYGKFTVTDNRANVGDAITKAAKAAYAQDDTATSATVDFTVTPYTDDVAGEANTYTHTVESYIDYSFSTVDISETTTQGKDYAAGEAVNNNVGRGALGLTYKNTLFTYGVELHKDSLNKTSYTFGSSSAPSIFAFFAGAGVTQDVTGAPTDEGVWSIEQARTGVTKESFRICLAGQNMSYRQDLTTLVTVTTKATATVRYTVGVFDTYGINGVKSGETFYVLREKTTDGVAYTKLDEYFVFADNETLQEKNVTEDSYNGKTGFGYYPRGVVSGSTRGYSSWTVKTVGKGNYDCPPLYQATNLSLSLNGDIGVNVYVNNLNAMATANLANVKAQINFKENTVENALVATGDDGEYKFSYAVAPKEIDEKITARLVIPGGPVGEEVSYTVRDWVNWAKEAYETDDVTYAKDYTMATALENYCDAAKNYFSETPTQPDVAPTLSDFSNYAPTTTTAWSGNVTLAGISLLAETNTTLRVYFTVNGDLPTVKVAEQEVEPTAFEQDGVTYYYVEVTNIVAYDLDAKYTFEFGNDNVMCSALTYGCALEGSNDGVAVTLINALLEYNQVANTYFAK